MGSRQIKIHCNSCQSNWIVPATSDSGYARAALESQPCPCCGLQTMSVQSADENKPRERVTRSFVFPTRLKTKTVS